ncbi:MAG: hypothetical protein P8X89_15210 [Reinekea sp.]|jgi:hypothetical protein
MNRVNWSSTDHYYSQYSQMHQEDAQHASQPGTGHTSTGFAHEAWGNQPAAGQPYLNPYMPAQMQMPSSPGGDLEYFLQNYQPTILDEIPETGQMPAGVPARGASNKRILNKLAGQVGGAAPYQSPGMPALVSPSPDGGVEYFLQNYQPSILDEIPQPQFEAGHMPAGTPAREAAGSYPAPGQQYWNPNTSAQMQPEGDLEYFLRTNQPSILDEITQAETGQMFAGAPANYPAPGQPYWNPNTSAQMQPEGNLEYFLQNNQPSILDEIPQPQYEAGQMFAGAPGPSYWNPNTPAQMQMSPGGDVEHFLQTYQPSILDETALPETGDPMQTEAMWATVWQLTGQTGQGHSVQGYRERQTPSSAMESIGSTG